MFQVNIYNDKNSSYEELLTKKAQSLYILEIQKYTSFSNRNLYLDVEIKHGLLRELFTEFIARETEFHYNLKLCNKFRIPSTNTVYHSSESISFLEPKTQNILPDEIKQHTSLNSFKKLVIKWKSQDCAGILCNAYINGVRFFSQLS